MISFGTSEQMNCKPESIQSINAHIRFLAERIGPRGTGTHEEILAADYVADCLTKWGIPFERLSCRTIVSMNHYPISINMMGLLAFIVYPIDGGLWRWLAALLACLVAPFLALTVRTSGNPLRFILPKVTSPSVLGVIEPLGEVQHQVVLISHLDTNKCRLTWKPERLHRLEPLTYATIAVQAVFGILYLVGAILGQRWNIWFLSLLPGSYLLGIVITLLVDDRTPYSPGANDNASAVGVSLAIAQDLSQNALPNTRIWLAFTGAEETDHYGLRSVLAAHPHDLRQAVFIDLEGVGSGDLVYVTRHGIGLHYFPDAGLLQLARRVAEEQPDLPGRRIRGEKMIMSEEVSTLTHLGYRAVCIAGHDSFTRGLSKWHQADDTFENLDPAVLLRAKDYTCALLNAIDQGER